MSDTPQPPPQSLADVPVDAQSAPKPGAPGAAEPQEATPGAVWVIVVLAGLLVLAAFWYALFAAPQRIGPDTGLPGGATLDAKQSAEASGGATSTTTAQLSAADVNAVLAIVDYTESSDASTTEYNTAFDRAIAGVDLLGFARSQLASRSSIVFTEAGSSGARTVTGAEKDAIVSRALAFWVHSRDATGTDERPLNAVFGVRLYPPTPTDRNVGDSLFEVMAQGLQPLGLMFGARDADDDWSWKVVGVSVTGRDTADVTYTASTVPGAKWHFADPGARYVKHLRFSQGADGRWRLAGWTNYPQVDAQFRANVTPPGSVNTLDEWWGSL